MNGCWGVEHAIVFSLKTYGRKIEELIKQFVYYNVGLLVIT